MARACLSCSKSTPKLSCLLELEGKTDGVDEAAERGEIQRVCGSASENAPALSHDRLSEVCDKCLRGTGDTISAGSVFGLQRLEQRDTKTYRIHAHDALHAGDGTTKAQPRVSQVRCGCLRNGIERGGSVARALTASFRVFAILGNHIHFKVDTPTPARSKASGLGEVARWKAVIVCFRSRCQTTLKHRVALQPLKLRNGHIESSNY